tara:strand:- start:20 stop:259 length:240 start_codon:yes stop_codon:yes gene_type:complete
LFYAKSKEIMSEQNLLSIGSILAAFLGSVSLYLVMKNKNLVWNEKLAGLIISWIFIAKAVSNGNFSVGKMMPPSTTVGL